MADHAPQTPPPIVSAEVLALVGAGITICIAAALTLEALLPGLVSFLLSGHSDWRDAAILASALVHVLVTFGHTYWTYGSHLRKARDHRSTPVMSLTPLAQAVFVAMWFPSLVIVLHAACGLWRPDLCLAIAIFETFFAPAAAWAMERRPFVLFDGLDGLRRGAQPQR